MIILGVGILCILVLITVLSTVFLDERKKSKDKTRPVILDGFWQGNDRRSTARLNVTLNVRYSVDGKHVHVESVDVSTRGIRLTLDEKFEKGTVLRLEIKLPGSHGAIKALGEIAWSDSARPAHKNPSKRFFTSGIKFVKLDKPGETKLFNFIRSLKPRASSK